MTCEDGKRSRLGRSPLHRTALVADAHLKVTVRRAESTARWTNADMPERRTRVEGEGARRGDGKAHATSAISLSGCVLSWAASRSGFRRECVPRCPSRAVSDAVSSRVLTDLWMHQGESRAEMAHAFMRWSMLAATGAQAALRRVGRWRRRCTNCVRNHPESRKQTAGVPSLLGPRAGLSARRERTLLQQGSVFRGVVQLLGPCQAATKAVSAAFGRLPLPSEDRSVSFRGFFNGVQARIRDSRGKSGSSRLPALGGCA